MNDRAAFERAVAADPSDTAPRLVFADWLDEKGHGDEARIYRDAARKSFSTDRERVRYAFRLLRRHGYFARMSWWCCSSCGWSATPEGKEKVVFFHEQDAESFGADGDLVEPMYISHRGDMRLAVAALAAVGLVVDWSGEADVRIAVHSPA